MNKRTRLRRGNRGSSTDGRKIIKDGSQIKKIDSERSGNLKLKFSSIKNKCYGWQKIRMRKFADCPRFR